MRVIIGYGNTLRGEDGFGVDVIKALRSYSLENTKLISAYCLTPELALELLDTDEIIFVDACYDRQNSYALACTIQQENSKLSHHILPKMIISILSSIYNKNVHHSIYSLLTNSFDVISDECAYRNSIKQLAQFLSKEVL